ncbi:MAG: dienelactone hydrolase family protein [Giesbergeria sp.]|jgi:phospholipase/carboxylesterase|nr:dienelactone hydrolase family protein [Giesbergeria sp.]MBP6160439.1 dienelactone hydrolase family protein [Giesbergeria sp.]MBP7084313.1 dienelactone hydrolase family protein [Giesbergeria sp.]MBP9784603.1 dienelactone hydrolase family protein [Giesbergeria sp.]MBP9896499.1 dienelactone hydrolase family protein [Giesbergeria sp.]
MLDLPLTFLKRPALPSVPQPWLLVLLHGVGSNEQDLYSLCAQLPERYYVLSLRAPYRMGPGAFAWFDYSIEPGGVRTIDEAQEAASRALLAQTLAAASEQLGIPPERTVVAGFSQGGAMALGLLLTQPALMRAAIVWHGRLLDQPLAALAPADAFRGRALWVSHGTHDGVIPLAHAQAIAHHVAPLPLAFTYREFPSEHEIRPSELAATLTWLEALSTTPNAF